MARTAQPHHLKRFRIIGMVHFTIGIATVFAWFLYKLSSLQINLSVRAAISFVALLIGQFGQLLAIPSRISRMAQQAELLTFPVPVSAASRASKRPVLIYPLIFPLTFHGTHCSTSTLAWQG